MLYNNNISAKKFTIGFLGYRSLVGNIVLKRIRELGIYNKIILFDENNDRIISYGSSSIYNFFLLKECCLVVSCKVASFSKYYYGILKSLGIIYVDASSAFRINNQSTLILDPINIDDILNKINISNNKNMGIFCGCNCTVGIMLISLGGLIKYKLIKSIFCSTYQSISGAGYYNTVNLFNNCRNILLKIERYNNVLDCLENELTFRGNPLVFSNLPWIGNCVDNSTSEEVKGMLETKKITCSDISVFSTCVRINTFRCHSESLILILKKDLGKKSFFKILYTYKKYIRLIKNDYLSTFLKLNSLNVSNNNRIFLGRIRRIKKKTYSLYIIGDQLIWGASEPLVRFIRVYINNANNFI